MQLSQRIEDVQRLLKKSGADFLYVSGFDQYLNEYTPLDRAFRYGLSGFTGSTGILLISAHAKSLIFVDGRYHLQADQECDSELIEVVKCPLGKSLHQVLLGHIRGKSVAVLPKRTPYSVYQLLQQEAKVIKLDEGLINVDLTGESKTLSPIIQLKEEERGDSTAQKIARLGLANDEALFVSALDEVSWLINCRAYHLAFQSMPLCKALIFNQKIYLFANPHIEDIDKIHLGDEINIINGNFDNDQFFPTELNLKKINRVLISPSQISLGDYDKVIHRFANAQIVAENSKILELMAIKDDKELVLFRQSFERSNKAIAQTIRQTKKIVSERDNFSELEFSQLALKNYRDNGAFDLSFKTIGGFDANGAIIHYGDPSDKKFAQKNSVILFDSGGYFSAGLATDTTRTFLATTDSSQVSKEAQKLYTLVLKGLIQAESAIFNEGALGSGIDLLARAPMLRQGYDYAHGTGHGVGINVHEGEIGFGIQSRYPIRPGQVVSIEPGIYISGQIGIRLENVVEVIYVDKEKHLLGFRPLTYIGYDEALIDDSMLTEFEKDYLQNYHKICKQKGNLISV